MNTALGNFAGYVAGSMVTVVCTYRSVERRAIRNLFGLLPRKHLLPEWVEWGLALLVGFMVMEFVRYVINREQYEQLMPAAAREGRIGAALAAIDLKIRNPNGW